jgi:hypothetical protein
MRNYEREKIIQQMLIWQARRSFCISDTLSPFSSQTMGEGAFQTRVPLTIHLMAFKKTYMVTLIRFGYLHNPPLYIIFQTQMHSTNSRSLTLIVSGYQTQNSHKFSHWLLIILGIWGGGGMITNKLQPHVHKACQVNWVPKDNLNSSKSNEPHLVVLNFKIHTFSGYDHLSKNLYRKE